MKNEFAFSEMMKRAHEGPASDFSRGMYAGILIASIDTQEDSERVNAAIEEAIDIANGVLIRGKK